MKRAIKLEASKKIKLPRSKGVWFFFHVITYKTVGRPKK